MRKEIFEEIGKKIAEIIFVAFVTTSLFLLLKYFLTLILKLIAMYYILGILKFVKIFGL
jgi:hypothetical protein